LSAEKELVLKNMLKIIYRA